MPAGDKAPTPAWIRKILEEARRHEGHAIVSICHVRHDRPNYPKPFFEKACLSCGEIVHPIPEV